MKKIVAFLMLMASVAVMTCCTAEDPFEEYNNDWNNNSITPNGNTGNSSTTGELTAFDVAIDKATAEPTDVATAYNPDEEDALENSEFTTEVSIDMSNPVAKTVNGVEVTVNGGELWLKSTGSGGKGINVDMEANFNGGSVYVVTTGGQYKSNNDTSSPKGIKADGNITISGGRIWVRTSGTNGEGIETKKELSIKGGEVASYAYDDAINSKSNMTISGGYVFAQGQHNDGLDANGNCYIKGGTIFAICSGTPEVAIDANTEGGYKLYVTGGTIVAVGGLENGSSLSQSCYQSSSWSSNTWYALTVGSSTFAFKTPSSGGSGLVVSGASEPTLLSGVSVSGGTSYFGGLGITGGTVSGGTSVSLSSYSGGNGMKIHL